MSDTLTHSCRLCTEQFGGLKQYLVHLKKLHRHMCAVFPCSINSCHRILPTERTLRIHLIRSHNVRVRCSLDNVNRPSPLNDHCKMTCTIPTCSAEFDVFRDLSKHLLSHVLSGRTVECPFPNCSKKYNLAGSLTGHMSKCHRSQCIEEVPAIVAEAGTEYFEDPDGDLMNCTPEEIAPEMPVPVDPQAWLKSLAEFFMRLQFKYLIPARTVQYIASEMQHVHNEAMQELRAVGTTPFASENERKEALDKCCAKFQDAFERLKSCHLRLNFYKHHYLSVAPEKLPMKAKGKFFYYVSIKATLQKMMRSTEAHLIDLNPPQPSQGGLIRDFYDGKVYQTNFFFQNNPKAFRIILFQDAFELVCPIGSAKKKYKLVGVYMSLGNVSDHLRTHPDSMQLVALCKDRELEHETVFGKIANELKELETDGVEVSGHGIVKGSLLYTCGDNLGSHGVGGFVENSSTSRYFCRYCLVDRPSYFTPNGHVMTFPPRTKEIHTLALQGNSTFSKKGVKFDSVFNSLESFHVCNPGLPPCLGHDILEGIASHDLALILQHLIRRKWFTCEQLNDKISSFPYSTQDRKDKPLPFSTDNEAVKGKMWQVFNTIRLLPIMLEEFIKEEGDTEGEDAEEGDEEEDEEKHTTAQQYRAWRMLLLLGQIMDILSAPAMHKSWLGLLSGLIWEYLDLRRRAFHKIPLRPKHHYLLHYCEMIVLFGSLGKVWTLRFESKHKFFKNSIRSSRNFINVMVSCSNRHELFQAYQRAGGDTRSLFVVPKSVPFQAALYSEDVKNAVLRVTSLNELSECTKATVQGSTYLKGNILPICQTHYEHDITFGRVLLILFKNEEELYFLVEILQSQYLPNSRAYKLGEKQREFCVPHSELLSYYPLHSYNYKSRLLVKLKHGLLLQDGDK